MKVLFLLPAAYPKGPASAKLVQRLAIGLTKTGVPCEVLCVQKDPQESETWRTDTYGIPYFGMNLGTGRLNKMISTLNFPNRIRRAVQEAIIHRGVTLVWIYNPSWFLWRQAIAHCRKAKTPVVAHLVERWPFRWHLRTIYLDQQLFLLLSWRHLAGVVGISTPWMEYARARHVPAIRIPVPIPPCTTPVPAQITTGKTFNLLYVGQLYRRDLPDIMLQAMHDLARRQAPVHLTVVGKHDVWPEGRSFYHAVQNDPVLKTYVHFTGYLTDQEYEEQVSHAQALVLLHSDSSESRSCFPSRLPEFLSTGRPVITSGVGDIPLYLRNNVHAILLSPRNSADELVSAILRLAGNPQQATQMGIDGRAHALEEFSPTNLGRSLESFLSGLEEHRKPD